MTQSPSSATPMRKRPPKAVYNVLNPLFVAILRSPLHRVLSKRLLALSFTGRKSGKRYVIPVAYGQTGSTLLITTQSGWSKNMRGGAQVEVRLQGQARQGHAELFTDEQGLWEGFRTMLRLTPELSNIVGVGVDGDGNPQREDVARARQQGFVLVQIQLN